MNEAMKQIAFYFGGRYTWGRAWWIGAELKSGKWTWEHSKKQVTYWSDVGASSSNKNTYGYKNYRYVNVNLYNKRLSYWRHVRKNYYCSAICQINK